MRSNKILVTGGSGFIGCNLIRMLLRETEHQVLNLDMLTYAGTKASLADFELHPRYSFVHVNICDADKLRICFERFQPDWIIHLAAESHVDRSIDSPMECVQTNIIGTYQLLETARFYYQQLDGEASMRFRFLHVSTDEVYGSLGNKGFFTETTTYDPNSPYSATKAASDHLAQAWHRTYRLPVLITHSSNNYGPYQFPEKLIPLVISKALASEPIPVYGNGENIRDWLYVEDHVLALYQVMLKGKSGETYNIGGNNEMRNIDLVNLICEALDKLRPKIDNKSYREQITFVKDRPGHDIRYSIDTSKIQREIGWSPQQNQLTCLYKTIEWYLENQEWLIHALNGRYQLQRLGLTKS